MTIFHCDKQISRRKHVDCGKAPPINQSDSFRYQPYYSNQSEGIISTSLPSDNYVIPVYELGNPFLDTEVNVVFILFVVRRGKI